MKKLQNFLEYYALSAFASLIRLFPLSVGRFAARRLADIAFYFVPIRKKHIITSLSLAFSGKTAKEILEITHRVYTQFALTMMELIYFPKLSAKDIAGMVKIENPGLLKEIHDRGKGAVFVGAHFGNWELMGAALAQIYPVTFVVGKQENKKADDLLNSYRLQKGIKIVPLKMALRGVMKTLKANEFVAILADQDAHEDGVFVNFFGRPASTPKGPALFALRARCPLVMGHIFREDGGFSVLFEEIPMLETGDENQKIEHYTRLFTALLEKHTRDHPDHWFWFHRRWKTKPPS